MYVENKKQSMNFNGQMDYIALTTVIGTDIVFVSNSNGRSYTDTLSPSKRSKRMSLIRCKGSVPERKLRSLIHSMGFRYRLHVRKLPGTPDMVFPSRNSVIFMHGCFWHMHEGCNLARLPKSRVEFWTKKLNDNRARDIRNIERIESLGWRVLVVWECELSDLKRVSKVVCKFLNTKGYNNEVG